MSFVFKEIRHALRNHFAHVLDGEKVLLGGGCDGVDVAEMPCNLLGGGLSDITDAEGEKHALEGYGSRGAQAL